MKTAGKLVVVLFFIFAIYLPVSAQENAVVKNSGRLVLQVKAYPNNRAEYYSIPGSHQFNFQKTAAWDSLNKSIRATGIRLSYTFEKDAVKLDMILSYGELHDRFSPVMTYMAYEHKPLILSELSQFGIEPFQISVVPLSPEATLSVPQVTSKAPSIAIVGVDVVDPVSQSYMVSFRNNSKKNLYEMEVHSFRKTAEAGIMWPTGERGQWLAAPGEVFKAKITSFGYGRLTNDGYVPDLMTSALVKEALFDDGTFEGDTKTAATRVAVTRGRWMQMEQIIKLFEATSAQSDNEIPDVLKKLTSQIESLPTKLDEGTAHGLIAQYPLLFKDDMSELILGFEAGMTGFKRTILADIVKFKTEHGQSVSTVAFNKWLTDSTTEYQQWAWTMK